jgi:hypothetical protein
MQSHRFALGLALAGLLALGLPHRASAFDDGGITTPPNLVTVDENGHGSFQGNEIVLQIDPPLHVRSTSPLTYDLPFDVVPGDVILLEPTSSGADAPRISDVIHFSAASGVLTEGLDDGSDGIGTITPATLTFYSDSEGDGDTDLADGLLPVESSTNEVILNEVGSEGDNGAFYTPLPGQPGFIALDEVVSFDDTNYQGIVSNVQYHFISDVPEPGSLALLATGGLPLLGVLRRRRLTA